MRNAFLAALFLGTFFLVATAQDSVTITSDPRDLSRPISSLINQIRQREKVSVTYEDPRYLNPADTEDVTAEASKDSELEKAYGPCMLVPKSTLHVPRLSRFLARASLLNFFRARRLTSRQYLVKAEKIKPGTGTPLHTQEPVAVASFRTWRVWLVCVAW